MRTEEDEAWDELAQRQGAWQGQVAPAPEPSADQLLVLARQMGWNTEHNATNSMLVRFARAAISMAKAGPK